jgi:hypothetical protein
MKILLLHPEDEPLHGPWIGLRWDAVYDLARSGWAACERWSRVFCCPVRPIDGLREGGKQIGRVREVLQFGLGRLLDREGLDWWELTALLVHQHLESLALLRKLAEDLPPDAEVAITRDGFEAGALRLLLGKRLRVIASPAAQSGKGLRHYRNRLSRLPGAQILEILGDKYDTGYRVRRHWHRRRPRNSQPVVLLPSAYVNVSLIETAYAGLLPDQGFLLVSTRRSGRLHEVPGNVRQAWLASYASAGGGGEELRDLLERWAGLKKEMEAVPELATLAKLGFMNDFPRRFADGLAIRDAWRRVLEIEPVRAVLCGDDTNPYTRIPLLLAARGGLPTLVCHHGGLDGRYLIKTNHADVVLAKGRMEADYLVNTCGVNSSQVEIGAPSAPAYRGNQHTEKRERIVFFSEPYEMSAGRTDEIYRDILRGLVDLAGQSCRKLVVKLHPSENLRDRREIAQKILGREQTTLLEWVTGGLQPELLNGTWFGVTVLSSVALDCAVHGVPCFVCDWLDLWPYGYVAQYRKFGVGIGLGTPEAIARIPEMLASARSSRKIVHDCWEALSPQRFEELLAGRNAAGQAVAVQAQRAE